MHKLRVRIGLSFDLEEGEGSNIQNLKRIGETKNQLTWMGRKHSLRERFCSNLKFAGYNRKRGCIRMGAQVLWLERSGKQEGECRVYEWF